MGRKRAAPRIVKKSRKASQKKNFNVKSLPQTLQDNWDPTQSFKQNFDSFGLQTDVNKRFRASKDGRKVMKDTQKAMFKSKYGYDMNMSDDEYSDGEEMRKEDKPKE